MSRSKARRPSNCVSLRSALIWSMAVNLVVTPASAVTTLIVDLSKPIGPASHVASGSLYGVTEKLPTDVNGLIAPLRPKMFTNPAANVQQPVGDAIVVAGRVASTGATVTIRLADWLKGFYTFTSLSDWLDKVGQTVSRRKAAALTNIYGYEIWNEPGGTWSSSNPVSFNELWKQTYALLRKQDPGIKIIGPSYAYFNQSYLNSFLSFCKANDCVPDIIAWHELGGGDLTGNIDAYRSLERQLGIGPLPISINEYSGAARIDVEGQPGASAPIIAKFERARVDTACISYWDVAHAGRLGSLLATNTEPNGGWWFYKWYGEMSGTMVSVTPPTPTSATVLDGFASLDVESGSASVLFGGVNDGTIQIVVKGFKAAAVLASTLRVLVERTPFVNRTTVVKATSTLSTTELVIANDQVSVSVPGANATDGYRVSLRSAGGGVGSSGDGAGGVPGAGRSGFGGFGGVLATGGSKASVVAQNSGGLGNLGGSNTLASSSNSSHAGGQAAIGGIANDPGGNSATVTAGAASSRGTTSAGVAAGGTASVVGGGAQTSDASALGGAVNTSRGASIGGASGNTGATRSAGGTLTTTSADVSAFGGVGNAVADSCGCRMVGLHARSTAFASIGILGALAALRLSRRFRRDHSALSASRREWGLSQRGGRPSAKPPISRPEHTGIGVKRFWGWLYSNDDR